MTVSLFIDEPPLQVLPTLVNIVGIAEAIVLQELHYQLQTAPIKHGRPCLSNLAHYCANRYPFWDKQFIEHIITGLERSGILIVASGDASPAYTIDYDALQLMADTLIRVTRPAIQDSHQFVGANTNRDFVVNIWVRQTTPNDYIMVAENKSHFLAYELQLEVKNNQQQSLVICYFPQIDSKKILKACKGAHIIYNIIIILFHASVLDQLLVFCAKQKMSNLVIMSDAAANMSLYQEFLKDLGLDTTKMNIPADHETRLKLAKFMHGVSSNLKRSLQAKQKTNPHIAKLAAKLLPGFIDNG